MKHLYWSFSVAFAIGYLGPVVLCDPFAKHLSRAAVGTGAGVICALLVFGGLHFLLRRDREPAEDFLSAIKRSGFTAVRACMFGISAGAVSGLIYPFTAWIRPHTGGRSIDDVFGNFYWAPVGAVYAFAIASTRCFQRAAAARRSDDRLTRLRMRIWSSCVTIAVGAWLFFAVPGLFPGGVRGIDLRAPHAWVSILPLFIICGGIGSAVYFSSRHTDVAQRLRDQKADTPAAMTKPVETFVSSYGMRRFIQMSPSHLRISPTGGLRIFAWVAMGLAVLVYSFVGVISLLAPHLSDGAEFPLLIITPFFAMGLLCETVPRRFTFDGERKEIRYGNLWSRRTLPFDAVEAVQLVDTDGWQLNLILDDSDQPRIHVLNSDKEATLYASGCLADLLRVEVVTVAK